MDVIVKADIIVSLVVFFTFTGVSGDHDVCRNAYTNSNVTAGINVVNVCNNSSTSTFLKDVYFDTQHVPLSEISRCTCNLVFEANTTNTVDVEISGKIGLDNDMNITGLGLSFLSKINTFGRRSSINTEIQRNSIEFVIEKNNNDLETCLRISQKPGIGSLFRISCFPSDINPSDVLPTKSPIKDVGAAVGGSIGGAVVLVIGVGAAIIIIRKRRNTSTPNNEEYEVTENAMYGATKTIQQAAEYETIDTKLTGKGSSLYSDKSSGDNNTALRGKPDTPENEYNHLNDVSPVFFTGNVYSSTGNTYSSTGSNQLDEHQVGSGNVYDRLSAQTHGQKNINKADNVYD